MTHPDAGTATTGGGEQGGEKASLISLGCPKGLVDTERIMTQLRLEGYEITPHYEDAGGVSSTPAGLSMPPRRRTARRLAKPSAKTAGVSSLAAWVVAETPKPSSPDTPKCWVSAARPHTNRYLGQ